MATSPEIVRLATNASRALADTALDSLRDAVLVIDARAKHLPIVLANATARRVLTGSDLPHLVEMSLTRVLGSASEGAIDATLASLSDPRAPTGRVVTWLFAHGEQSVMTDIKLLASAPGQRLVMLSFAPVTAQPDLVAAVDQLPLDLLIVNADLKVTYANTAALRSSASMPGGVLGCSVMMLTPTSMLHADVFARALEGNHFHDEALAYHEPDRATRWFEVDVQPLKSATGVVGLVILTVEVTERRVHNRAQGSSERRLLALTEHARDIISIAGADGRLHYVSGGVRNSLGYTSQERQSNFVFEHVHPDDYEEAHSKYRQLVLGEIEGYSREFRVRHKDGSYRWLESSYASALDNPLIGGVVINSRDITERKQAEFKLAQREEVFRLAADAVDGVIYEWDITRGVVNRSRGVLEVLGIAPEDLEASANAWFERIHPRDFSMAKKAISLALINGRGWTTSYRIRDARGRYKSILERGLIQRNAAGDPVRAIGCCVDVSEIKRLTDILDETQRLANIGGWEYSYLNQQMTWTEEMFNIYDTSSQQYAVPWDVMMQQCSPESAVYFRESCRQAEAVGSQIDVEIEIITFKGQKIWVRIIGHFEMLDGKPFRAYGSLQNIQAKKLAQIALENSTGWLMLSMNMAYMHAWRWDKVADTFEFATLEGADMHIPPVQPGMQNMLQRIHPIDRTRIERAVNTVFAKGVQVREEFQLLGDDDQYRSYAITARPLSEGDKEPHGLVGVIQDVTAQRESERRLRRSEELLRVTTTNTADTLFLLDTALRVRFINKGMNNKTIEQVIGCELAGLLPETARSSVLDKLRDILETGETATYEFESMEDGRAQYFENRAVLVRDDGIGTGISISMRDVTERKRLEQEILDVSGRERQSIGRDLHDGLGQELTGVALMLRGLATRIQSRCPDVVENVNEVVGLVNQSIDTARALARGLLPVRTETGGLVAALRTLAGRSHDLYGLEVNFRVESSPEFALSETNGSHLYRIAQEALTNAARHGRASLVNVNLSTTSTTFSLRITDDGEGFVRNAAPNTGMGLKIMKYRADMIGAKFEIEANLPHGTIVQVTGDRPPTRVQSSHAI
jgi:PAS domain S-box-containing protein